VKLTRFAFWIGLIEHVAVPCEAEFDILAEAVFAPFKKPKGSVKKAKTSALIRA
jgi:hypothetical protein